MADNTKVVGIGASAGGVEALQALFAHMPADSGMAFVVITHLAPKHESALPEIIGRATPLTVREAEDGADVCPGNVYVITPDRLVTIADGRLSVRPAGPQQLIRHPVDVFLGSLAEHSGEHAIAIILSGSGTDGTLGVKAVKERGGLTVAQGPDHSSPRHAGMPNSAIASGLVDLVLPVEQIPEALTAYIRRFETLRGLTAQSEERRGEHLRTNTARQAIYSILHDRLGHDFSGYKETTLLRRVQRRMSVLQAPDINAYVERLRQEPEEASLLLRDLLIGVTNFFRDTDAFAALGTLVVPRLFEGKGVADRVRVWVPGCATGEEAYSVAILLREHAETMASPPEIKVFASDINEPGLAVARTGRYPGALLAAVSAERLGRFFVEDAGAYAIARPIRDMCVFSAHSLVRDPPFSQIDLISCRNLLIYFNAEQQRSVIPIFHYALRPGGFLFLGEAEGVSQHSDLFGSLDKKHRIFQRRDYVDRTANLPRLFPGRRLTSSGEPASATASRSALLRRSVETHVLERFSPCHVVVNGEGDVVHYSTRTGNYLEAPAGQPSRHLLSLARRGLRLDLRAALQEASQTYRPVKRERVALDVGRDVQLVDIIVEPLPDQGSEPLFLVLFQDAGPPAGHEQTAPGQGPNDRDSAVDRLERELRDTRERLQSVLEEHETGIEELRSSNEELVSLNEELQSTNEELETNKEELQSVNEELHTVNADFSLRIEDLNQLNSDLQNIFDGTQIALVFLDSKLMVRRFTAPAAGLFNLMASDGGRPLTDITHRLDYDDLETDIRAALISGSEVERRIARRDGGGHYLARVLPYRGANNVATGVIITMFGIDKLVDAEHSLEAAVARLNVRLRRQAAIADFGAQALRTEDLDALLHEASLLVAKGLEIERAKVLELLPGSDRLLVRAGVGWGPGVVGKATIGADGDSPAGFALQSGEPVVSDDLALEQRFKIPDLLREHRIRSAINVIIRGEGAAFGVLEVDSTQLRHFTDDDVNFMQSCANQVASAIDRLRSADALRRAFEDKQVLLKELQHRVKNSLQEISALVSIERRKVANVEARRPLDLLGARLEALSIVYRKLYLVDHHAEIDLGAYLTELAAELVAFHGIDPSAIVQDLHVIELRVDVDSVLPLGLIACEFIVNSFKHAFPGGRGRITLRLERVEEDAARLTLADNGIGLPQERNRAGGSGLVLIARLVEQVGGELQVTGEGGVTMTITFPVRWD